MKRFVILAFTCWTLLACAVAGASAAVEAPPSCSQCGMDRTMFAHSRVLLTHDDGTSVGLCSIHCAAKDMKQNEGKKVTTIMVADYGTKELIDARTASWVVGGQEKGVMTSEPKWAFAREEDAKKFMAEKGGQPATFDEVLKAANEEAGGGYACHDACHGPGALLTFNPAFGEDIYHTHPAGMWMFSYKYMRMSMDGLRDGTSDVDTSDVGNNRGLPYDDIMMIPTSMTMDMHMLMAMYGINDRLTVMAMANYIETKMDMLMDMGPMRDPNTRNPDPPMKTSGLGDTELRGIYKFTEAVNGSLGVSLPTGDIDQEYETTMPDPENPYHVPYDMQLGSGTFDLKPAVTLNYLSDDALWNWGGQAMYTLHLGRNDNDYSLGDSLKLNTWLQRALGPAATWVRLAFSSTGSIDGHDDEIQKALNLRGPNNPTGNMMAPSMPDADPDNYGGQRIDGFIGASLAVGPVSIGLEGGIPLYQDLNGLQMKNDWYLTAGVQAMF